MAAFDVARLTGQKGKRIMGEGKRDPVVRQYSLLDEIPTIVRDRPSRVGKSKYAELYGRMIQLVAGQGAALKMLFESQHEASKARSAVPRYEHWAQHNGGQALGLADKWATAIEPLASNHPEGACWLYIWIEPRGKAK